MSGKLSQLLAQKVEKSENQYIYSLKEDQGEGFYRIWKLNDHITLTIASASFYDVVTFNNDLSRRGYELIFWMSGESSVHEHFEDPLLLTPGSSHMAYLSYHSGYIRLLPEREVNLIQIDMDPVWHQEVAGDMLEKHIRKQNRTSPDSNHNVLFMQRTYPPEIQKILNEILHHSFSGKLELLYLEGKTLELIAQQMKWMSDGMSGSKIEALSRNDVERLHAAKGLLLTSLDDPPTIRELAMKTGLNEFKLKRGFKALFGTTVYGMLRLERMRLAGELLSTGEKSITETALEVGYSNMSHFAAAFRTQYGVNPAGYRKQRRSWNHEKLS